MGNRLSWVRSDCRKAGRIDVEARRGLMWKLERQVFEGFWPDETRDLRARRSTRKSRVWKQRFKQRTDLVEVENEAVVAPRRGVRRRSLLRRRVGSSRVNESDRWMAMPSHQ